MFNDIGEVFSGAAGGTPEFISGIISELYGAEFHKVLFRISVTF